MFVIQPKSRSQMDAAHQAARVRRAQRSAAAAPAGSAAAPRRNLQPILELGDTTYFQFRGRAYGVPPLPWKAGQRLMDAYLRAIAAAEALGRNPTDAEQRMGYYRALAEISPLLWAHCRVAGWHWQLMRRLRLLRNPFQRASEAQLLEIADFFLQRRMKSHAPPRPALTDPRILQARQITSMIS